MSKHRKWVKKAAVVIPLLVLCVFFFSQQPSAGQATSLNLYRLEKSPKTDTQQLVSQGAIPRQELAHCLIVAAPAAETKEWTKSGIAFTLLDERAEQKSYFLVLIRDSGIESDRIEALRMVPVEESIFLYAGDPRLLETAFSAPYSLAALPQRIRFPGKEAGAVPFVMEPFRLGRTRTESEISKMVRMVSKTNITVCIQTLQNFQTRYTLTPNCQAAGDYILNYLSGLGIETRADSFTFLPSYFSRNIIGTSPGKTSPQNLVILCAHYDSTSNQAMTLAPGADDNASGTAAVMEAARIISQYPFDFSVRYLLCPAEEQGLYGSADYARKAAGTGEKIIAVINLDMVAFTDQPAEDLDLIANPASEWLADEFISATQKYASMPLKKVVNASFVWSDHASFWNQGFSALCGIEDANPTNPHYHKTHDTIDTLNLDFAESVTKAALAVAAEIAQPIRYPRPPAALTAHSQINSSLYSSSKTAYLDWQPSPDQVRSYNVYRAAGLSRTFQKINASPLTELKYIDRFLDPRTDYYYAVTAVDDQNQESNFTQVVKDNADNKK